MKTLASINKTIQAVWPIHTMLASIGLDGFFIGDKIMRVYDPRIIAKETELIKKVQSDILTWDEAVEVMDKYIESLGYPK